MRKVQVIVFTYLFLFSLSSLAQTFGAPAKRLRGTSYIEHVQKLKNSLAHVQSASQSPERKAVPYTGLKILDVVEWPSLESVESGYARMRDERFLRDSQKENFIRRSTWLYPDDGCYARAELARKNLVTWSYAEPSKIFVFGDLSVTTENHPEKTVSWWYHVVAAVRVGETVYALDPSIEAKHPLTLEEWLARMSPSWQSLEVAICSGKTYDPYASCVNGADVSNRALYDQTHYLNGEWIRQLEMGRNPEQVLGEKPPWKN